MSGGLLCYCVMVGVVKETVFVKMRLQIFNHMKNNLRL